MRIEALGHRVDNLESRVSRIDTGQTHVELAIDKLISKVAEWDLKAVDSEGVKVREEQKTKRWVAVIGLITMIVAPAGTITANQLTRETPTHPAPVVQSSMQKQWEEKCTEAPSDEAWLKCVSNIAAINAPPRKR